MIHAGRDVLDGYVGEVARAVRHGFEEIAMGERPFTLWDGAAFRLRRTSDRGIRR